MVTDGARFTAADHRATAENARLHSERIGRISTFTLRPGHDGANIRTWIGFKHYMFLAESAVIEWFRKRRLGPGTLFHTYGVGFNIVESSLQLPSTLDVDDDVIAVVGPLTNSLFDVRLYVQRGETRVTVARGKLTLALVRERESSVPLPEELINLEVRAIGNGTIAPMPNGHRPFTRSWRVPYYTCQLSDRMQHSGYVRALEETVDDFLTHRGIAVGRLLADRHWIPVVSRARVEMLAEAHLDEPMQAEFTVTDILRNTMFEGRMDCYVERDGGRVHTATGQILHGYAVADGPDAGSVAELDPEIVAALTGARTA
jgi:acyl-CoA thioesterase FadM